MFGRFEIERQGVVVDRFGSRLDEQLLALLALRAPTAVTRPELATGLWPHMDEVTARKQISYYLFKLKQRLGGIGLAGAVDDVRGSLRLTDRVDIDSQAFLRHLAAATRQDSPLQATKHLQEAVALYGEGLLPGLAVAWLPQHRDPYFKLYQAAAAALHSPAQLPARLNRLASMLPPISWLGAVATAPKVHSITWSDADSAASALVAFAAEAGAGLASPEWTTWLEQIDQRLMTIEAHAMRAIEQDRPVDAFQLVMPIWRYWQLRGSSPAGLGILTPLLEASASLSASTRAPLLHAIGALEIYAGAFADAETHLQQAIVLWRELDDVEAGLRSRATLGTLYFQSGDFAAALQAFSHCLTLAQALGNDGLQVRLSLDAARAAIRLEDVRSAREHLERRSGLLDSSQVSDLAENWAHLAAASLLEPDLSRAQREADASQMLYSSIGDQPGLVHTAQLLGRIAYEQGDFNQAKEHCNRAVALARQAKSVWPLGVSLAYLATVLEAEGNSQAAAETLAQAELLLMSGSDAGALERARTEIAAMKDRRAQSAPPGPA